MSEAACCCCGITGAITAAILFALSWASLKPTEFGLLSNEITGYVDSSSPYGPGRHLVGPWKKFIKFPATASMIEFSSNSDADAPPIELRTGRDSNDPDSGGQPIRLSLSFLYKLRFEKIGTIYRSFSTSYKARYIQFARQAASDVVQKYEPARFWDHRHEITADLLATLRHILATDGGADVVGFQLLRFDFNPKYETSILGIQLATQARTTKAYQKQVIEVLKDTDILQTQAEAIVMAIEAGASARAKLVMNQALANGFNTTQTAKAAGFQLLVQNLGFSQSHVLEFLSFKSLRGHASSKLIVGTSYPL